jgi:hypothetical protein
VTVVTSAARLLADKPPKIGAHAASWIQQKGGKVRAACCCTTASKRAVEG